MRLLKFALQVIIGLIVLVCLFIVIISNNIGFPTKADLVLVLVLFLIYLLSTYKFLPKSINIFLRNVISLFIAIAIFFSLIFVHQLLLRNFFEYYVFVNKDRFDISIPMNDLRAIHTDIQNISQRQLRYIELYPCHDEKSPNEQITVGGPLQESKLCQSGDVLVTVGEIKNPDLPLGAEAYYHFYLMRKVNGVWILIEDLGEGGWIS